AVPTTIRSASIGRSETAGPSAATMRTRTPNAAAAPDNAARQPRVTPTASTTVSASTASTADARKTPAKSSRSCTSGLAARTGKRSVDPRFERVRPARPDRAVEQAAVTEEQQRRDALHTEARRDARVVVDVHLHQLQPPRAAGGDRLERGRDHAARAAPGR